MANTPSTPILVGDIVLQPEIWANEAQTLAAEYAGMPESTVFLTFARRFAAVAKHLQAHVHQPPAPHPQS